MYQNHWELGRWDVLSWEVFTIASLQIKAGFQRPFALTLCSFEVYWGNLCFFLLNWVVYVIFQVCFKNKMTERAPEASEGGLCLYSLLGLPLEKCRSYSNIGENMFLFIYRKKLKCKISCKDFKIRGWTETTHRLYIKDSSKLKPVGKCFKPALLFLNSQQEATPGC